jgi:hypothetical protein
MLTMGDEVLRGTRAGGTRATTARRAFKQPLSFLNEGFRVSLRKV